MVAETQWLFTEAELRRTPSILDGMPPEKERENRSKGVNFILQVGIMLKLPQMTLATASVFLHRFYMRHSMQDLPGRPGLHYYSMAATSLFLATKVEETCRKMKELVIACVRVAQKDPNKMVDEQDKEYWRWRDNILQYEDLLLEAICFDLSLEPPYKTLFEFLLFFGEENNKRLRNAAWAFVNDSCLTMLCLFLPSRTIAAGALYAAAKHCDVAFPDDERGRPWWEIIAVDLGDIRKGCNYMAEIYENIPSKAGKNGGVYERTPEAPDEQDDKTRIRGLRFDGRQNMLGERSDGQEVSPLDGTSRDERPVKRGQKDAAEDEEELNVHDAGRMKTEKILSPARENSPRKRQRTNGDEAYQQQEGKPDQTQQTGVSMIADISTSHSGRLVDGAPQDESLGESAGESGLVSPRFDGVSEEGELEP